MRVLLVDGDELLWRVAVTSTSPNALREGLRRRIDGIAETWRGDRLVFALSGAENWRKALWAGYKAHRANRRRPALLRAARAALEESWPTRCEPRLEADDVLGLAATTPRFRDDSAVAARALPARRAALSAERVLEAEDEYVIVSRDKDLLTVPGLHAGPCGVVQRVTQQEAAFNHMMLVLAGDPADGYKGCPGVGPVRARRVLTDARSAEKSVWRAVVATYAARGVDEEQALLQARLARVLRHGDLDRSGRVVLWSPRL